MQMNTVAWNEGQQVELEKKLLLEDAISDLPAVSFMICWCFSFPPYFIHLFTGDMCILLDYDLGWKLRGSRWNGLWQGSSNRISAVH